MTAAWALILVLLGGGANPTVATGTTYFANRDMCEAARKHILAESQVQPAAGKLNLIASCELMGINALDQPRG